MLRTDLFNEVRVDAGLKYDDSMEDVSYELLEHLKHESFDRQGYLVLKQLDSCVL